MKNFNLKFLFLVIIFSHSSKADLAIGSECRHKDNSLGICLKIMDCKPVMEQMRAGTIRKNIPTICSQSERTICCLMPPAPVQATNSLPTTTTSATTTNTERPLRISERKCREYAKSVIQSVRAPSLIIGEKVSEVIVDKCKHNAVSLIVGGTEAELHEFPHQALLGYNEGDPSEWGCGGSLISRKFVLTAAHCLYPRSLGPVKFVKLGMYSRSQSNSEVLIYSVEEIIQHPNYNAKTFNEDIGLLRLNATVTINELILPICLPTKQHDNVNATASGFGRVGFGQASSDVLLKVDLEKFTHEECQQAFGKAIEVRNDTMMCYGHHTKSKDSCSGDSGGPLQIRNDLQVHCTYIQIGVVSFGLKKCGTIGKPGVYVNVFYYLDWIEGIVWKDEE